MAFDETLAARVRAALSACSGVTERKMFGGITFMLGGNMCCGVLRSDLILRVGGDEAQRALREEPGARPFEMTGRPSKGMVVIGSEGCACRAGLAAISTGVPWLGAGGCIGLQAERRSR
jgi:TfoX/Sxy family transcriptional regulator of competence genes